MEDCIVIGGGPAGLSAAVNLRQRGHSCLVLYAGEGALLRAPRVDNCAGLPGLSGMELLENLRGHAAQMGARLCRARVGAVLPAAGGFCVSADADVYEGRSVVLACGALRGGRLPGEEEYLGRGVSYCATCDGMLYRRRACVVWGNAADTPQQAAYLAGIGVQVTWVAQRPPAQLPAGVTFLQGRLQAIEGDDVVRRVRVDGQALACEGVFLLREAIAPEQLLPGLRTENGLIAVDRQMATSLPGVFAAGDCTGAPLQVSKALGEGQIAGLAAAAYVEQAARQPH